MPGDHLLHFITENWINLLHMYGSLLNPVLLRFGFTVYIMFQVDPRKHRLLLEVFDENRLVSYLVMFKIYYHARQRKAANLHI